MTFTTPVFLIFLVIVFAGYWLLRRRAQNVWLLAASLVFYGWWDWRFLGLLLFTAGTDFLVGLGLERERRPRRRQLLLGISLASNLGTLGFFKYADFFIASFQTAAAAAGFTVDPFALRLILPVGISFYTFQALSYTIDVYRRQMETVHDPIEYFGFISFFPQLVAGPIERATNLLRQFRKERRFDEVAAADGARQMLWGFFKKMVIADNLAPVVNAAYANVDGTGGWPLLWATYAFAIQVYCDFSGYTDIAIGCARWFGFDLMRNFAYPYFSRGIPEFWRRWHVSLSTWFRDYLFIPLGGSRVSPVRRVVNILITFTVSGFWHGAAWTYVVWGFLHGVLHNVYSLLTGGDKTALRDVPGGERLFPRPRDLLLMLLSFNLVVFSFFFFRADSLATSWKIMTKVTTALATSAPTPPPEILAFGFLMLVVEWIQREKPHALAIGRLPRPFRLAVYYAVVAAIVRYAPVTGNPFIYFQF